MTKIKNKKSCVGPILETTQMIGIVQFVKKMIGVFMKDPYSDIGKDLTVFIPKFDKIKIE